ncbi:hypothetical protein EV356DRAFT_535074 [Viridothelium virens]|uniref:BTB domain-containing protein n=1 Tax=Viridothelium virens TaxID=1048519 RepID=A0A6A6H1P6_VIRVR|nr:hypothetical protein EV356DRAFT_535074 [Viridothelium virens]
MVFNVDISKSKNPLKERKLGPVVKVVVSREDLRSEKFYVHETILCARSDFFRKACRGAFKESVTKTLELKEENPDVFAKFMEWIYTGDYEVTKNKELDELIPIYILADKIQATRFKDETIDKLMNCASCRTR